MLSIHSARQRGHNGKIGLAIAGGGPIGGMYELGALRALDEALDGLDLTRMDCYVGVSSGAFLAAGLANRMSTAEMCRIFITGTSDDAEFRPETFLRPNVGEYLRRAASLPGLYADWVSRLLRSPHRATRWSDLFLRFGGLVPTGIFDNQEVERFLRDIFTRRGRSNDFRTLDADLFVVAVDLDSGEAVRFGEQGWDDVPISRAVQASSALPGLYPPVEIGGRHFLDGALRRTMHASTVLDRGIDLMIGVNPLVPFDANQATPRPTRPNRSAWPAADCRRCCRRRCGPCCSRACRSAWRSTRCGIPTSTSWCSSPTRTTASCSSPTFSASPRATGSASWPTATRWPTCASAQPRSSPCWPHTASATTRTSSRIATGRSSPVWTWRRA